MTKTSTGIFFFFFFFLQIKGLWQSYLEQYYQYHFFNSVCSLFVSVSHFGNSCNISIFHNYYICYDDLWSVVFGINIIIIWGHHKLCSYKMEILLYKYSVCFDCSSPFSGLLILWDIAVLKLGQLIPLQWPLSFQVKGRVTHFSFLIKT